MKILQVGLGNNPGGVEAFVMNYFRELSKNGVSFDFVSMYGTIAYEKEILSLGGRVFYVPNVKRDYFGYVKEFTALLEKEKYDVVHVNMLSAANILPLQLAKKAGVKKVIAHSHNASAPGMLRKVLDKLNRPKLNRYADRKLACSEVAGRWLFGEKAYNRGEVILVSNAIDTGKYAYSEENRRAIRQKYGIGEELVIGHVGRFQVQKNHDGIAHIFYETQKIHPKAKLCLIGDGELKESIEGFFREKGILDKVIFTGVCPDVERYLSAMDVFLFPSLFEGLPFTLLEAQANGLPCVISDTITPEAVLSRENVHSLPLKEKPEIWAEAVLKIRETGRTKTDLAARRVAEAGFDITREADKLMKLYQE